jgi:uncharacterized protein (DUF1778 family)
VAISRRGERVEEARPLAKKGLKAIPRKNAAAKRAGVRARKHPSETNLSMRISAATLDMISTAAASEGKTRTEFVLESARRRAMEVLLDQRLFVLDDKQYAALLNVLDNPPKPNAWLRRLMTSPAPWEE